PREEDRVRPAGPAAAEALPPAGESAVQAVAPERVPSVRQSRQRPPRRLLAESARQTRACPVSVHPLSACLSPAPPERAARSVAPAPAAPGAVPAVLCWGLESRRVQSPRASPLPQPPPRARALAPAASIPRARSALPQARPASAKPMPAPPAAVR